MKKEIVITFSGDEVALALRDYAVKIKAISGQFDARGPSVKSDITLTFIERPTAPKAEF